MVILVVVVVVRDDGSLRLYLQQRQDCAAIVAVGYVAACAELDFQTCCSPYPFIYVQD